LDYTVLSDREAARGRFVILHAYNHSAYQERFVLEASKSTLRRPSGDVCNRVLTLPAKSGDNFHMTVVVSDADWNGAKVEIRLRGITDGGAKVRWKGSLNIALYRKQEPPGVL
jgi:hypothetical protein